MYVTRRPNFRANRNYVSPTEMLPNYNRPRFDFRACDPAKEGYGKTQWLVVEGIQMPEGHCPTCEIHFTFGTMSCGQCGTFLNTASDLCKAAQVIRMEELASEMGVELSLDMVQEDRLQGTGIRNTPAGTHGHDPRANRSGINILKTNARSHVNKADKMGMTISQRQLTDPLYAFNCAAQDLSPLCISFLEKLANAVIPDPPRTHQMIMQGVGHRYAGKLIYINDPEKVGEADMSKDFLVYWKNRLYRPEIFAASYAQSTKRPPILGFHSEWKTDEKDPDELLQLLLDFIAEDIAFIPNVDLQLGKETRTMVVPRAKAESASAKALARAAQDQARAHEDWHQTQWSSASSSWNRDRDWSQGWWQDRSSQWQRDDRWNRDWWSSRNW